MFELRCVPESAVIKVIGVGGGGGNAVKHMIDNQVEGVDFICANTDAQALSNIASKPVLQLGGDITKGLGAGANPEIGRQAAMEDRERIATHCKAPTWCSSPPAWAVAPAPARAGGGAGGAGDGYPDRCRGHPAVCV
jgi:cell division GTPase FtsZ